MIVGWREWVALPSLGVMQIKAKMDTGARTSALHAWDIEWFTRDDAAWVRFVLHPIQRDLTTAIECEARLCGERHVTNSGGASERRFVIATEMALGSRVWPVEIGLTNRDEMGFRMLVGRTAMRYHLVIDPARAFLAGRA